MTEFYAHSSVFKQVHWLFFWQVSGVLHTWFTHVAYTRGLHMWFTHVAYTRGLDTGFTHRVYAHGLHTMTQSSPSPVNPSLQWHS